MAMADPDLLVLGSGLAAAAAAVHAHARGARVVLVELGDEVLSAMPLLDAAPLPVEPSSGPALDEALFRSEGLGVPRISSGADWLRIDAERVLVCDPFGDVLVTGRLVVIAAGADGDDDEELRPFVDFYTRGLSQCAWSDAPFHRGRPVVVFGGGDRAAEQALHALAAGCQVEIVSPGVFAPRRARLRSALRGRVNVREHWNLDGLVAERGMLARVRVARDHRVEEIPASAFFHARERRFSERLLAFVDAAVTEVGAVLAGELAGVPAHAHADLVASGTRAVVAALRTSSDGAVTA